MNKKTLKITYGAMIVALFAVLLLINRQTGGMLQGILMYILPIPMVAYAARYGWKASIAAWAASAFISIFVSTPTTIIYAGCEAFVGMVLGTCIYHKKDMTRSLLLIMLLCVISELVNLVIVAAISGQSMSLYVAEMQAGMNESMELMSKYMGNNPNSAAQIELMKSMMSDSFILRILLVSMAFAGAMQGFLIYEVSLLILRRLHIAVPKPKPIALYTPPSWTAYLGVLAFILYNYTFAKPFENEVAQSIAQVIGIVGFLYLLCFGVIAMSLLVQIYVTRAKILVGLISVLSLFMIPQVVLFLGAFYVAGQFHRFLLRKLGYEVQELPDKGTN
ncbi:DUF2232 domain-containing protein [Oribacterium sp. WCC10]|uniref:DUF2232 domain-containing protein n=1 Tax=Oribacterium sp. WCC10 TaxID=1855343 RepID=UPI0008E0B243|nr:DUF2232 domain-containing protein [Oribacterium sp. WCC10]SFG16229.1 Uncharacterized conserved protein YybS, DUF2232 family [Oribacterium sp. WCC10]